MRSYLAIQERQCVGVAQRSISCYLPLQKTRDVPTAKTNPGELQAARNTRLFRARARRQAGGSRGRDAVSWDFTLPTPRQCRFGHSNLCMPFKIFVCSNCKSALQAFSFRVKVSMPPWLWIQSVRRAVVSAPLVAAVHRGVCITV